MKVQEEQKYPTVVNTDPGCDLSCALFFYGPRAKQKLTRTGCELMPLKLIDSAN